MVTTDDGSAILFRSPWRLAGSNDTAQPKIFRWDAKGFSLVFSAPASPFINPGYAFDAFLSGDGRISGYGTYPGCSGAACSSLKPTLVLNGAAVPAASTLFPPFQVSRDGRFLAAGSTVVNLSTGAVQTAPGGLTYGGRFGIGNNGGLLMLTLHQFFPVGSTVDLTLSSRPDVVIANSPVISAAVVSASESRVIYEIGLGLWSYDVAAGQSTKLAEFDGNPPVGVSQFQPSISNNGSRVLYRRWRVRRQRLGGRGPRFQLRRHHRDRADPARHVQPGHLGRRQIGMGAPLERAVGAHRHRQSACRRSSRHACLDGAAGRCAGLRLLPSHLRRRLRAGRHLRPALQPECGPGRSAGPDPGREHARAGRADPLGGPRLPASSPSRCATHRAPSRASCCWIWSAPDPPSN